MDPMTARWGICGCLAICLAISAGCRTTQPDLRPKKEPEQLVAPPALTKYSTTGLPDQAFDKMTDPDAKAMEAKLPGAGGRSNGMTGAGMMGQGMGSGRNY